MAADPRVDLVVIGGGPAGCAAAVMASSLGLRAAVIERETLCSKLGSISSMNNVLGGFYAGPPLADQIRHDVAHAPGCEVLLGKRAEQVSALADRVVVTLDTGRVVEGLYAVVATGVRPMMPADVEWISGEFVHELPALWEAARSELCEREAVVLGVDRPLGTLLRALPDVDTKLTVLYHPAEQYKLDEVSNDPRVSPVVTSRLWLDSTATGVPHVRVLTADGERSFTTDRLYLNLGSLPNVPSGDIVCDPSGYSPPDAQHPRVMIAGDLRSVRHQRIMTAFGSGSEAALKIYYELAGVH